MMSNRLAISAALSVLMMTAFVLYGPTSESATSSGRAGISALPLPSVAFPLR